MTDARVVLLTKREAEVAYCLLYDGADNPTIGRRLVISLDTVKSHVKHILTKTGTLNRTAFVVAFYRGEVRLRGPIPGQTPSPMDASPGGRFRNPPLWQGVRGPCPEPRSTAARPAAQSAS